MLLTAEQKAEYYSKLELALNSDKNKIRSTFNLFQLRYDQGSIGRGVFDSIQEAYTALMEDESIPDDAPISLSTSDRLRYYKVLGLEAGASRADIKKAYAKKALRHHPSAVHSSATPQATSFKAVQEAYAKLMEDNAAAGSVGVGHGDARPSRKPTSASSYAAPAPSRSNGTGHMPTSHAAPSQASSSSRPTASTNRETHSTFSHGERSRTAPPPPAQAQAPARESASGSSHATPPNAGAGASAGAGATGARESSLPRRGTTPEFFATAPLNIQYPVLVGINFSRAIEINDISETVLKPLFKIVLSGAARTGKIELLSSLRKFCEEPPSDAGIFVRPYEAFPTEILNFQINGAAYQINNTAGYEDKRTDISAQLHAKANAVLILGNEPSALKEWMAFCPKDFKFYMINYRKNAEGKYDPILEGFRESRLLECIAKAAEIDGSPSENAAVLSLKIMESIQGQLKPYAAAALSAASGDSSLSCCIQ